MSDSVHATRADHRDVLVVGTYPPTRCGLATFTANTRRGLLCAGAHGVDVLRLGEAPPDAEPPEVVGHWRAGEHVPTTVSALTELADGYATVLLQHEFGIYPGHDGIHVLDLVGGLHAPVVSVLHTVLVDPSQPQRRIIEALVDYSARAVVQTPSAARRLTSRYFVDPAKVAVIAHGAEPNVQPGAPPRTGPPVLLTWGLLGPGKGIEHAIRAVAILARRGIPVRYVVSGQTHPGVVANEGERYRESLVDLVGELGVADRVEFDNQYRDWPSLLAQVRACDIVVLPYDSREQVTSGVLVDALASAKPIVATAFPHAVDVVDGRCGLVVAHEEPVALADAIERLVTNRALRDAYARAAGAEGSLLAWPAIGAQYLELLRSVGDDLISLGG
jgi:glycosyltransferase involved in cell wall biosynthesis